MSERQEESKLGIVMGSCQKVTRQSSGSHKADNQLSDSKCHLSFIAKVDP